MKLRRVLGAALASGVVATIAAVAPGSAAPASTTMRVKYFGADNVDASTGAIRSDRVILSWFGVTNFAAAIGGHVVLLDAWIPRGEYSGYVPSTPAELAALQPEFIFAGHSHFDHLADAAEIMTLDPTITLVGTAEHCTQVRSQAMNDSLRCIEVVPEGAAPGTEELNLAPKLNWNDVAVRAIKHIHSAGRQPDSNDPHTPVVPPPDLGIIAEHLPSPDDTAMLISHLGDEEGGTLLYRFDVGGFSLAWHDSSGPLKQDQPELLTQIAKNFGPVDVELGAIMGFNQITNGLGDPRTYTEALRAKVFVPTHHDNWAPPVSTNAEGYRTFVEAELQKIPADHRPELLFIADPHDYVDPTVLNFDINAARWTGARPPAGPAALPSPAPRPARRPLPATGAPGAHWVVAAVLLAASASGWRLRRVYFGA